MEEDKNRYLPTSICHVTPNKRSHKEVALGVGAIPGRVKEKIYDINGNEQQYNRISNRLLMKHIQQIKSQKWSCIVCLVPLSELKQMQMPDYVEKMSKYIPTIHLPIRDGHAPSVADANILISHITTMLSEGKNVLIHCRCGLGRAGTIAAATILHYSLPLEKSIALVREKRPGAIQTPVQEKFLKSYAKMVGFR